MFNNFYKDKKVLVLGHTGFKGSWLSQWLLKLGAKVAGYSLYIPSNPSHFEALGLTNHIQHFVGDVRDLNALTKVFNEVKPDIVFHLAAQAIVHTAYKDPRLTFETNLMGMVNVLEILRHSTSVKAAVLITSDKCYENVEWEFGYRETDRLGGKDPYSASKACAEIAFSSYSRSFFGETAACKIATTRAGNVIGGGDWADYRIVPDCMKAWSNGSPVIIRNPKSTRPWQHVLEPLGGYLWLGASLANQKSGLTGESFNFGPPTNVNQPVSVLIETLAKDWSGARSQIEPDLNAKPEAGLLKLNCDKALNRLNWQPTLHFHETATLTAQWYHDFYTKKLADCAALTNAQIDRYVGLATERHSVWTLS